MIEMDLQENIALIRKQLQEVISTARQLSPRSDMVVILLECDEKLEERQKAIPSKEEKGVTVQIPAYKLIEKGIWQDACELLGLDQWAVNEGKMDEHKMITLTEIQAKELGVI